MTYKEFYIWLDGYLTPKLENKHIDIVPIVEKMGQVKEDFDVDQFKRFRQRLDKLDPITITPNIDNDDLGKPPKIVM